VNKDNPLERFLDANDVETFKQNDEGDDGDQSLKLRQDEDKFFVPGFDVTDEKEIDGPKLPEQGLRYLKSYFN